MANNLLTISMITNEALMVLENELTFTGQVDRNYDDQFAVVGAKIGNTVNVRRPGRFIGTTGPALNVEDFNETSTPVVLNTQFHVDTQFTTQDLSLSLDMFSDRVLKPAIAAIANKIDFDGTTLATQSTANTVGTAGTVPSDILTFLTAQAFWMARAHLGMASGLAFLIPLPAPASSAPSKACSTPTASFLSSTRKA
jgi:hypothetical protein